MALTKAEFARRWDSDDEGGGITFNDIADCAVAWGITSRPYTQRIDTVASQVVAASGALDPYDADESTEDDAFSDHEAVRRLAQWLAETAIDSMDQVTSAERDEWGITIQQADDALKLASRAQVVLPGGA